MTITEPAPDAPATPATAAPVTVIGLGAMGHTLARAFLDAGHPTTVWNRTPARADDLVADGARRADSVGAAVAASPLTILCVLDRSAGDQLLLPLGDGLAGRTIVDLTSVTPEDARDGARRLTELGVAHLNGAIMVPTPMIGTAEALLLFSGDRRVFETHEATLRTLAGQLDFLGQDPGLAALHDVAMLDLYFTGLTGFLHATALVERDGIDAQAFLPYAEGIVSVLGASLADMARDLAAGSYSGEEDNLAMELTALDHIVEATRARGLDPAVPELTRGLVQRAVEAGHGRDGFTRVIEQLRGRS